MFSHRETCYCAFCRSAIRTYRVRSVRFVHMFLSAVAAVTLIYLIRRELHPSAVIIFVLLLLICEFFLKIRWRMAIICRQCGFDPILYKKDIRKTVEKVRVHLERRKQDPAYVLARPLNLPTISAEKAQALAELTQALEMNKELNPEGASLPIRKEGKLLNRQI